MKKNILLLLIVLLLMFSFLECGFRVLGYHGINTNFNPIIYSQDLGWKLKNSYKGRWSALEWDVPYETNSQGFRDKERKFDKTGNLTRIIVLGDSHAEGWGVKFQDMWQVLLENKLGDKFEVVNFGVRGYDIIQEYRQFLQVGVKYHPDIVIQMLNANDFGPDRVTLMGDVQRFRPEYRIKNGVLEFGNYSQKENYIVSRNRFLNGAKSIIYKSAFLSWIKYQLVVFPGVNSYLIKLGLRKDQYVEPGNKKYEYIEIYNNDYNNAVEIIYKEFSRLAKELNFKMLVVYIGSQEIDPDLKSILERTVGEPLQIRTVRDQEWRYEGHTNVKGHAAVAEDILEYLSKNRFLL